MAQIISEREPPQAGSHPDEISIDLAGLKDSTLRALEKFVVEVLSPNRNSISEYDAKRSSDDEEL